jgi:hypothetical protein
MGCQILSVGRVRAGGFNDGSGGQLGNGDVIWMPITPVRTERDDHMGLDAPQVFDDLCHHFGWVGLVQFAIEVSQKFDAPNAQDLGCRAQFCLPYLSQRLYAWICPLITSPATLTPRCGNEIRFDILSSRFREQATKTQ